MFEVMLSRIACKPDLTCVPSMLYGGFHGGNSLPEKKGYTKQ